MPNDDWFNHLFPPKRSAQDELKDALARMLFTPPVATSLGDRLIGADPALNLFHQFRTYELFISHAWAYSAEYEGLKRLLDGVASRSFRESF